MRSPAAVIERADAAVFIAIENLVAGLPGDPKFAAQGRDLLALEQAGHKPEPLVHDVTLLPRHAPSCEGAKVSPMCPEYGVTYLSGRTCASTICCSPGNHVSVWFDPLVSRTIPRSRAVFGTHNESDRDRCFSRTLSSKKFSR